jgi:hypothetical protein
MVKTWVKTWVKAWVKTLGAGAAYRLDFVAENLPGTVTSVTPVFPCVFLWYFLLIS